MAKKKKKAKKTTTTKSTTKRDENKSEDNDRLNIFYFALLGFAVGITILMQEKAEMPKGFRILVGCMVASCLFLAVFNAAPRSYWKAKFDQYRDGISSWAFFLAVMWGIGGFLNFLDENWLRMGIVLGVGLGCLLVGIITKRRGLETVFNEHMWFDVSKALWLTGALSLGFGYSQGMLKAVDVLLFSLMLVVGLIGLIAVPQKKNARTIIAIVVLAAAGLSPFIEGAGYHYAVSLGILFVALYARRVQKLAQGAFLLIFLLHVPQAPFSASLLFYLCATVNQWPQDLQEKKALRNFVLRALGGIFLVAALLIPHLAETELFGWDALVWNAVAILCLLPGTSLYWEPFYMSRVICANYFYAVVWTDDDKVRSLLAVLSAFLVLLGLGRRVKKEISDKGFLNGFFSMCGDPEVKFILVLGVEIVVGNYLRAIRHISLHEGHWQMPDWEHFHNPHFHWGIKMAFPVGGIVAAAIWLRHELYCMGLALEQSIMRIGRTEWVRGATRYVRKNLLWKKQTTKEQETQWVDFCATWFTLMFLMSLAMFGGEAVGATLTALFVVAKIKLGHNSSAAVWIGQALSVSAGFLWFTTPPSAVAMPFMVGELGWQLTHLMTWSGIYCIGVKFACAYVVTWSLKAPLQKPVEWPEAVLKMDKFFCRLHPAGASAMYIFVFVLVVLSNVFSETMDGIIAANLHIDKPLWTIFACALDAGFMLYLFLPEAWDWILERRDKKAKDGSHEAHERRELHALGTVMFGLIISIELVGGESIPIVNAIGEVAKFEEMSIFWSAMIMTFSVCIVSGLVDNAIAVVCYLGFIKKVVDGITAKIVLTAAAMGELELAQQLLVIQATLLGLGTLVGALSAGYITRGANPAGTKPTVTALKVTSIEWIKQSWKLHFFPFVCCTWVLFVGFLVIPWQLGLSPMTIILEDWARVTNKPVAIGFMTCCLLGCAWFIYVLVTAHRHRFERKEEPKVEVAPSPA